MRRFECLVCGYIYNEADGAPDQGIDSASRWEDISDDFTCPLCGASKSDFEEVKKFVLELPVKKELANKKHLKQENNNDHHDLRQLSYGELSALFSNLAKGCEKQYLFDEMASFNELAGFYKNKMDHLQVNGLDTITEKLSWDLNKGLIKAREKANADGDRGALRAIVWTEKSSKILNSLIARYKKDGIAILETTNIYVCEICGFVSIGDKPPERCPVCNVPKFKITPVERG